MATSKGTLYLVGTPIGNLEDITLRAIRTLKEVDYIACEDTRVTKKLLAKYEIKNELISYHKFNEKSRVSRLIELLKRGSDVAIVTNAGTPCISDPGSVLVKEAYKQQLSVIDIPGPCSIVSAYNLSGFDLSGFLFLGFFPRKKGDAENRLEHYKDMEVPIGFFESPKRLSKSLEIILDIWGNRNCTIAREITKSFEEVMHGQITEILEKIFRKELKGEIVIIVDGKKKEKKLFTKEVESDAVMLIKQGKTQKSIVEIIAKRYDIPKKDVYNHILKIKQNWELASEAH
ncbi:MAG: 16S rRNA (cytidine(1402)-2'-O)-methyltransferase [Pseudomonadota bacterium]